MVWLGRELHEVRSRTDYILGIDRRIFRNVAVRDPRQNSDQYLVLGCLLSAPLREHTEYLGSRKCLPLWSPTTPTREDGLFADLQRSIPKPKAREASKSAWILSDMWRFVNERVFARRDPAQDQAHIQRLGHTINMSLGEDRRRQMEEAGE